MGRKLYEDIGLKRFAVCETVSGEDETITPVFNTQKELIEHLVKNGTEWDKPLTKEIAEEFVLRTKFVPSMVMCHLGILSSFDCLQLKTNKRE